MSLDKNPEEEKPIVDKFLDYKGVEKVWNKTKEHVADQIKEKVLDTLGQPNGIATLTDAGTIPDTQLPSFVDDILEFDTLADFPEIGETGKIYTDISTGKLYRWSGTQYSVVSETIALGETSETAFAGDRGKLLETLVHNLVKSDLLTTNFSHVEAEKETVKLIFNEFKSNTSTGEVKQLVSSYGYLPAAEPTKGQVSAKAGAMSGTDKDFIELLKGNATGNDAPNHGDVFTFNKITNKGEWKQPEENNGIYLGDIKNFVYSEYNDTIDTILTKKCTLDNYNPVTAEEGIFVKKVYATYNGENCNGYAFFESGTFFVGLIQIRIGNNEFYNIFSFSQDTDGIYFIDQPTITSKYNKFTIGFDGTSNNELRSISYIDKNENEEYNLQNVSFKFLIYFLLIGGELHNVDFYFSPYKIENGDPVYTGCKLIFNESIVHYEGNVAIRAYCVNDKILTNLYFVITGDITDNSYIITYVDLEASTLPEYTEDSKGKILSINKDTGKPEWIENSSGSNIYMVIMNEFEGEIDEDTKEMMALYNISTDNSLNTIKEKLKNGVLVIPMHYKPSEDHKKLVTFTERYVDNIGYLTGENLKTPLVHVIHNIDDEDLNISIYNWSYILHRDRQNYPAGYIPITIYGSKSYAAFIDLTKAVINDRVFPFSNIDDYEISTIINNRIKDAKTDNYRPITNAMLKEGKIFPSEGAANGNILTLTNAAKNATWKQPSEIITPIVEEVVKNSSNSSPYYHVIINEFEGEIDDKSKAVMAKYNISTDNSLNTLLNKLRQGIKVIPYVYRPSGSTVTRVTLATLAADAAYYDTYLTHDTIDPYTVIITSIDTSDSQNGVNETNRVFKITYNYHVTSCIYKRETINKKETKIPIQIDEIPLKNWSNYQNIFYTTDNPIDVDSIKCTPFDGNNSSQLTSLYDNGIKPANEKNRITLEKVKQGYAVPSGGTPGQVIVKSASGQKGEWKDVADLIPADNSKKVYKVFLQNTEAISYFLNQAGTPEEGITTILETINTSCATLGINMDNTYANILDKINNGITVIPYCFVPIPLNEESYNESNIVTIPSFINLTNNLSLEDTYVISMNSLYAEIQSPEDVFYIRTLLECYKANSSTLEKSPFPTISQYFTFEDFIGINFFEGTINEYKVDITSNLYGNTYILEELSSFIINCVNKGYLSINKINQGYAIPQGSTDGQILMSNGSIGVWKNLKDEVAKIIKKYDSAVDLLSYGIRFNKNNASDVTRVGNLRYHKTLPIQSKMKGCVYDDLKGEVAYWLDENDWRFIKNPNVYTIEDSQDVSISDTNIVIHIPVYALQNLGGHYVNSSNEHLWYFIHHITALKINNIVIPLSALTLNTDNIILETTITISNTSTFFNEVKNSLSNTPITQSTIEFGSCLDGFDGEVMVYVPGFYIKSFEDEDYYEVRISEVHIDETWEYQPERFIGAYRGTLVTNADIAAAFTSIRSDYGTTSDDFGYLSQYMNDVGQAYENKITVTIANKRIIGGNRENINSTASAGSQLSNYGKPTTYLSRSEIRALNTMYNKHIMSYQEYKNIIYWLYVIEYANFNVQNTYTETLTEEGYKKGGLGIGVTTKNNWENYNSKNPTIINGTFNDHGNKTFFDVITKANKWRGIENIFGDIYEYLDGIAFIQVNDSDMKGNVSFTYDKSYFTDSEFSVREMYKYLYTIPAGYDLYIKSFDCGKNAHLIPIFSANATTGTCDAFETKSAFESSVVYAPIVGGCAESESKAGLSNFVISLKGETDKTNYVGFRLVTYK